jgi:hypothetical protein
MSANRSFFTTLTQRLLAFMVVVGLATITAQAQAAIVKIYYTRGFYQLAL